MTTENAADKAVAEVTALIKARCSLLWIASPEEARVERAVVAAATAAKYDLRLWDCATGVTDATGKEVPPGKACTDPAQVLRALGDSRQRAVWILRDMAPWLRDPSVCRALRSLARSLSSANREESRAVVVIGPSADLPPELRDHAVVLPWALPDREEIGKVFDEVLTGISPDIAKTISESGVRSDAIEAALGLTREAATTTFSKSIITQGRRIVPAVVAADKKRVINAARGIEWYDADPRGLDAVGGLDNLKKWLTLRRNDFSERARLFGIPSPRGCLCLGPPGTGKSLIAKSIAAAWGVPLLKMDIGGMKSKWVGDSEANIRASLNVVDAVGNCVLWADELEKSLAGATAGAADGGVSTDALGTLLTWMQEHKGGAFVVATANDVSKLPPELLRKGRFDEIFFVDLPTHGERCEVLRVTLKQYKRDPDLIGIDAVAAACEGFTGQEIASLVPDALRVCFADGERALKTGDLVEVAKGLVPLSRTAAEKITQLREWAKLRCKMASSPENEDTTGVRRLDD